MFTKLFVDKEEVKDKYINAKTLEKSCKYKKENEFNSKGSVVNGKGKLVSENKVSEELGKVAVDEKRI